MEVLLGFAVGYYLGARDGRERLDELGAAAQTIAGSAEFQALLTLATSALARAAEAKGQNLGSGFGVGELVGDQLKQVVVAAMLRRAA